MALEVSLTLPAPRAVGGGLLNAARPIPDPGWTRGLIVTSSECVEGLPFPYCNNADTRTEKEPQRPGEGATFAPVGITVTVDCSTLGGDPQKYAEQGLEIQREFVVASEFASGVVTGNASLADATPVSATGTGYVSALADLEQAIADSIFGRQAFIHVAPGDLVYLDDAGVIHRDGNGWVSTGGHVVVSSAAYDFTGVLYATGEVYAATAPAGTLTSIDREVNTRFVTAEELGIAVFDPCFNISVEVNLSS